MVAIPSHVMERALRAKMALARHCSVSGAYLFGSWTQGTASEESDIDVAAFVSGMESWDLKRRASIVVAVQREVGDDIELHLLPASDLPAPDRASFAGEVVRTGIPL